MKEAALRFCMRLLAMAVALRRGRRLPPEPATVRRIVVLQMSGVGDLVLVTPALRALHRLYPEAKIDLITHKLDHASFLFRFPYVRRGCGFPLFELELKRAATAAFWRGLARPIRFLREEPCDLYVSFHHTWLLQWYLLELWVAARSGARFAVGIRPDFLSGPGIFDRSVPESSLGERHYRPFFLDIVGLLGDAGKDLATEFPVTSAEIDQARTRIRQGLPTCSKVVCLHVGASHRAQLWPIDRFLELARRCQQEGYGVLLIGGRNERGLTEQIEAGLPSGTVLNVAGQTSLSEMAAFIAASDLFIGNDSGPMHVAIALRRPTIGLIGPGRPRYHRYDPGEAVMLRNPEAFDILNEKNSPYPWTITVDEVYARAKALVA